MSLATQLSQNQNKIFPGKVIVYIFYIFIPEASEFISEFWISELFWIYFVSSSSCTQLFEVFTFNYINDITKASSFHTTLFADDINLHMSNSSFNVIQTTVNLELCKIHNWLRANKLSLNYNKTSFMLLNSQKRNPTSFNVVINNHSISPEDKLKYLGVLLDNKLSWKPHVQKVKTQPSRACGVLTKLKRYTTQSVLNVVQYITH